MRRCSLALRSSQFFQRALAPLAAVHARRTEEHDRVLDVLLPEPPERLEILGEDPERSRIRRSRGSRRRDTRAADGSPAGGCPCGKNCIIAPSTAKECRCFVDPLPFSLSCSPQASTWSPQPPTAVLRRPRPRRTNTMKHRTTHRNQAAGRCRRRAAEEESAHRRREGPGRLASRSSRTSARSATVPAGSVTARRRSGSRRGHGSDRREPRRARIRTA